MLLVSSSKNGSALVGKLRNKVKIFRRKSQVFEEDDSENIVELRDKHCDNGAEMFFTGEKVLFTDTSFER